NPRQAFYKLWTQKEAVLKADGRGLSIPITEVVINIDRATLGNQNFKISTIQTTS
ncbi:unnamed protein product, partial [Chrysoparadoxa australica]